MKPVDIDDEFASGSDVGDVNPSKRTDLQVIAPGSVSNARAQLVSEEREVKQNIWIEREKGRRRKTISYSHIMAVSLFVLDVGVFLSLGGRRFFSDPKIC